MRKFQSLLAAALLTAPSALAWEGMDMPELKVEGRYLTDGNGNIVNLHGFAQTYSPWFNERGAYWTNYDVAGCLKYNKEKIDQIMAAGWEMSFLRLHMDPYWSNEPGISVTGENDISAFSLERFKTYLDKVFIPMAQYAIGKGMYVVMRPPGVCPDDIAVDDDYQKYLIKVWGLVAAHKDLKNNPYVMFELANEPVRIKGTDGTYGRGTQGHFDNLKTYFQKIVDTIRAKGANNILWIPGLGYQSQYWGYANNPIEGDNIGYAVHCYPGWYGSDAIQDSGEGNSTSTGGGYAPFQSGWDQQIKPVADFAPIMVTEMDWADPKYEASWGKAYTGTAGGSGFGANFKLIADNTGNVSWLTFTTSEYLAAFKDEEATDGNYTFLTDPEACAWPIYHWYQDYRNAICDGSQKLIALEAVCDKISGIPGASTYLDIYAVYDGGQEENVSLKVEAKSSNPQVAEYKQGIAYVLEDGTATLTFTYTNSQGEKASMSVDIEATTFPLTADGFDASIWETGSFDEATHRVVLGQYGFGGWRYNGGIDMSGYKYCVAKYAQRDNPSGDGLALRFFDENNYWSDCATYPAGSAMYSVATLADMYTEKNPRHLDPSHIYIVGFWSMGQSHNGFTIDTVYVTNDEDYLNPAGIEKIEIDLDNMANVYTIDGIYMGYVMPLSLPNGIYAINGQKVRIAK